MFNYNISEALNYGAVKYSPVNKWLGQIGQTVQGFVVFSSIEYGIRCHLYILFKYVATGYNTIDKIINRYSATDQAAYKTFLSIGIGIPVNQVIQLSDLPKLSQLIMRFETGGKIVPLNTIHSIINKYDFYVKFFNS